MSIAGQCRCGAVKFESAEAPVAARMCWCTDCQKWSCGNASVNAVFKKESFTVHGETSIFESVADSGNAMQRSFCPVCGTPLFSESSGRPHLIVVRAGALDDPMIAKPEAIIWTASAPSWAPFDPALPQYEKAMPA
jgi:hypothetical protein